MATTTLIQTVTVGAGGAASIDFTVPAGYTDLMIVVSARSATADRSLNIKVNGSSSGYSGRELRGYDNGLVGSTTSATTLWDIARTSDSTTTANTFGSYQIYLPNYAGSTNKSMSSESVEENNSNTPYYLSTGAGLWSNTAAITSISILPGSSWAQYSTASLYGITKWAQPTAKATGGTIVYGLDGYTYHTFTASGTFTPTSSVTADVLVVAGGGGGGLQGGGGGAGGFQAFTSQTLSSAQTVTVGAGGAANSNGANSSFGALTASVGGGTGSYGATGGSAVAGGNGGSGGGGGAYASGPGSSGGTGTSGQGFAGGTGQSFANGAGGGGGATAVGANAGSSGGAGGAGNSSYSAWASATGTGASGAYAGGGGGSGGAAGGIGGGGTGGSGNGVAGTTNTGGGGGGAYTVQTGGTPAAGGSGIVIVRYAS